MGVVPRLLSGDRGTGEHPTCLAGGEVGADLEAVIDQPAERVAIGRREPSLDELLVAGAARAGGFQDLADCFLVEGHAHLQCLIRAGHLSLHKESPEQGKRGCRSVTPVL